MLGHILSHFIVLQEILHIFMILYVIYSGPCMYRIFFHVY